MNISNNFPALIGISGTLSSGKDTLADFLVKNYGYMHVSTGDMVRAEAQKRYGNIERPTLQIVGPELRAEGGAGVLVDKALAQPRPLVITGIRAIGEAKTLKNAGGILLFIDANIEIRYGRMKKRARDAESIVSFQEFAKNEKAEVAAGDADADFNQVVIQNMADKTINNSGDLDTFYRVAVDYLSK
jgi:dephospho-CoA kinase